MWRVTGEELTLTSAFAAVYSLAHCVKVQPSLQQRIAEDPRLPLLECPWSEDCDCHFKHHDDRRAAARAEQRSAAGAERRRTAGMIPEI